MMGKNTLDGQIKCLELYGRVCGSRGTCDECLLGQIRGDGMTCQEFLSKFPQKALSLLMEMEDENYSYYNEYITRFPSCNLGVSDLSEIVCRKVIFEGYVECQGGDCVQCWLEKYNGDYTDVSFEEDDL